MSQTPFQKKVAAAVDRLGLARPEAPMFNAYEIAVEIRRAEGRPVAGTSNVNYKSIHALGEKGVHWDSRSCMVDRLLPFGRGYNGKRLDVEVFALNPHHKK